MKFFFSITLKSSCPFLNWAYLYDAQDTLEPFRLLTFQYSMRHNLQPKNDVPNIACSTLEIPSVEVEKNVLLISLPKYLHSMKVGTQHAYEYGLCLQHLLEFEHFQNYIATKSPATSLEGKSDFPIKYKSTCRAASLPSEIAQTINDCPRRISPAAKIFGIFV